MTDLAQQIVEEARSWKGTRFVHQGRVKGLGVDCVGFISEVAKNVGLLDVEIPADYRPREDGQIMLRLLREHMKPVRKMQPGDVIALCDEALRNKDIPRHLAFVTEVKDHTTFICHASAKGVVEHRTDQSWLDRIHSVWRLKRA